MSESNENEMKKSSINKRKLDEEKENNVDAATSQNSQNGETVSLAEFLNIEKEQTDRALAVLGASDASNCSYDQGYVYRQALYGCATCLEEKRKTDAATTEEDLSHGICLACSYECHPNHELYELYTKRSFKCDCGNQKFAKGQMCKLQFNKEPLNTMNKYNHNFINKYCLCNQAYDNHDSTPTEETVEQEHEETPAEENTDDLFQCIICEDWFHLNHLNGGLALQSLLNNDDDHHATELVCHLCMEQNSFFWYYQDYLIKAEETKLKKNEDEEKQEINVVESNEEGTTSGECFLEKLKIVNKHIEEGETKKNVCCALFSIDFRKALCKCENCLKMYKEKQIEFLLADNDTIKYYEDFGKKKEAGLEIDEQKLINEQMSKLNRIAQLEFLHNMNEFKEELIEFLADFAKNGQVVKRENIMEFFGNLKDKKKRKIY